MKNATKHADDLKSVCRKLNKEYKPPERQPMDALRALVRAALSFNVPEHKVDEAMTALDREFVDLNELRVGTELEAQELLGGKFPQIEQRVGMIVAALNNIFEREHTMNLERLKTISRRDARQFLREIPDIHPFVEAYVMLFAFDGHAFPIDDVMLDYLIDEKILESGTTLEDAQKFVEHHLKAEECYELFSCLRKAVFEGRRKKKSR
jgi:hypothetical protein